MKTKRERGQGLNLYVQSGSDYAIVDDDGKSYTPEEARALWESLKVDNFNMAFFTLTQCGWDIEKVKERHRQMDANRKGVQP